MVYKSEYIFSNKPNYASELKFVEKVLQKFRLKIRYISDQTYMEDGADSPLGLKDILNYDENHDELMRSLKKYCNPNTFYHVSNTLLCNYMVFKLPIEDDDVYACIGPFVSEPIPMPSIMTLADKYHVGPGNIKQLEQFYNNIPLIADHGILSPMLLSLGEYLWNDIDNFSLMRSVDFFEENLMPISPLPDIRTPEEALLSMQLIEQRYEDEHALSHAVSNGQYHKAELIYEALCTRKLEERADTPLRTKKNYALAFNTLLRIAAENGGVHPMHIDHISSQYAKKIEHAVTESACAALQKEMVRKYCMLVKNHSLKGYSLLVRKVITNIDVDLTADLSLKSQSERLNVNSSYLSTLFKKETGVTLTEYVNRKRIEHALLLLNSTSMQIQMIAQYCGIPDVNYFTKTFKKVIGKTPKEYREIISTHF